MICRQHCHLSICEYWWSWTNTVSEQKIILILKRGPFLRICDLLVLHLENLPLVSIRGTDCHIRNTFCQWWQSFSRPRSDRRCRSQSRRCNESSPPGGPGNLRQDVYSSQLEIEFKWYAPVSTFAVNCSAEAEVLLSTCSPPISRTSLSQDSIWPRRALQIRVSQGRLGGKDITWRVSWRGSSTAGWLHESAETPLFSCSWEPPFKSIIYWE